MTPDTPKEKKRRFFKRIWEVIAGTGAEIVASQPKERLAAKVPLKGNVNGAEKFTWTAVVNLLRSGFIKAFDKDADGSIDFHDATSGPVQKK